MAGGAGDVDRLSYALVATPLTIDEDGGDRRCSWAATPVAKTGIDRIEGGAGNDTLHGTGGQDFLAGGEGDDLVDGRGGGDVLDGGPGTNTVSYEAGPGPVTVDLAAGTGGALPLDSLTRFRRVVTGPGNDTVDRQLGRRAVRARRRRRRPQRGRRQRHAPTAATATTSCAAGSARTCSTAAPASTRRRTTSAARPSRSTVTLATLGGDGAAGENDSLPNIENLAGGASNDTLVGDAGANAITGGPGVNTLDGGAGDDQVSGGNDRDVITGGPGNDGLFGNGDDDSINAFDASKPDADVVACGESLDDDAQVDETDTVTGCEFSRRADVPVPVDDDQDGFVGGFDCDDHNPARNQGATDVPGRRHRPGLRRLRHADPVRRLRPEREHLQADEQAARHQVHALRHHAPAVGSPRRRHVQVGQRQDRQMPVQEGDAAPEGRRDPGLADGAVQEPPARAGHEGGVPRHGAEAQRPRAALYGASGLAALPGAVPRRAAHDAQRLPGGRRAVGRR